MTNCAGVDVFCSDAQAISTKEDISIGWQNPLLLKEGWTRDKEKAAKQQLIERTGWLVQTRT
jgi:hypothetical protein